MSNNVAYYSGVGSRTSPVDVLKYMTSLARQMNSRGLILRTGDATGADAAFREGGITMEVYTARHSQNDAKAMKIASEIHPAWHRCTPYAKLLHARNLYQVMGRNLDTPSSFLVCWTPGGAETMDELRSSRNGGTSTAIAYAIMNDVPVFNLAKPWTGQSLDEFLNDNCFTNDEYDMKEAMRKPLPTEFLRYEDLF